MTALTEEQIDTICNTLTMYDLEGARPTLEAIEELLTAQRTALREKVEGMKTVLETKTDRYAVEQAENYNEALDDVLELFQEEGT